MKKFSEDLEEDVRKDPKKIENAFRKFCKGAKGKENRLVSEYKNCISLIFQWSIALDILGNLTDFFLCHSVLLSWRTGRICNRDPWGDVKALVVEHASR